MNPRMLAVLLSKNPQKIMIFEEKSAAAIRLEWAIKRKDLQRSMRALLINAGYWESQNIGIG